MIDDPRWTDAELAILRARAEAVARREAAPPADREPAIFFRVGRQRCCAPARGVRSAIRLDGLVPIPHGGRTVAGAILRGGDVVPVFHLAAVLGERLTRLPETAHALLLGTTSDEVGVTVDAIDRFGELVGGTLREPPEEARSRFVTGATPDGELVVDLVALGASDVLFVDLEPTRTADRT